MLKLDPYSDGLLFQCERCQRVGELILHGIEEEGQFNCWNCLGELKQQTKVKGKNIITNYKEKIEPIEFFECVICKIRGERKSFVLEEMGGNFCLSCWLEKEHKRILLRPVFAGF